MKHLTSVGAQYNMKVLIVVALLAVGAYAKVIAPYEPIIHGEEYHEKIGIPEFERIKLAEEQLLADPSRIVGGSAASLGAFPYQGGLMISLNNGAISVCGCSLLSSIRSLTAAHCWWNARQMTVRLGSILLTSGGIALTTNNVQNHGSYNPSTLNNDISIISHVSVGFHNNIQPIAMATETGNTFAGSWATASGFGARSTGGGIPNNQFLSHVNLQVISNAVCAQTYGGNVVIDSTICTSSAGNVGICGGDSGGPLATGSGNSRLLIGVTSFGPAAGCAAFNMPDGYGRVTSFLSWIIARM